MVDGAASPTVFISYRRTDTQDFADRLYDVLAASLGPERIFMDVDSIDYGDDFERTLQEKLTACTAMLVLIGPGWLTAQEGSGHPRLDDPSDYVRREVEAGLQRSDVRVIPVLVHGAQIPDSGRLPPSLAPLTRRQAIAISREYFRAGVDRLLEALTPEPEAGRPVQKHEASIPDRRTLVQEAPAATDLPTRQESTTQTATRHPHAAPPISPEGARPSAAGVLSAVRNRVSRPALTILLLIFFFPAGLVLTWTYSGWSARTKWTVTAVLAGLVLLGLIANLVSH